MLRPRKEVSEYILRTASQTLPPGFQKKMLNVEKQAACFKNEIWSKLGLIKKQPHIPHKVYLCYSKEQTAV